MDHDFKVYVKNLLRKLNVNTRLELAAWVHANMSQANMSQEGMFHTSLPDSHYSDSEDGL